MRDQITRMVSWVHHEMRRMAFVQHLWCFHRRDGGETIGLHQGYCVRMLPGFKDTQPTTHGVPPFLARHTRQLQGHAECFSVFLSRVLPPSRVHYVFNTLLDRCVSGLLSLHNHRADALHFADQKFELVHQSSTTVLAQRCCEINSVADTSGTAVLNTQKLRQVVRMSRDVAVHGNVSFTRHGSAEKQLS